MESRKSVVFRVRWLRSNQSISRLGEVHEELHVLKEVHASMEVVYIFLGEQTTM